MALITRLSRLFKADFHAVLDRIEEPDLQLRQAVREMQLALDQDQQRLKLFEHEAERLAKAATSIEAGLSSFNEELDICLGADKDELARDLIRRKLNSEQRLQAIRLQSDDITSQAGKLEKQIDEEAEQCNSMKQKLELLVAEYDGSGPAKLSDANGIRKEDVEIALLREKELRREKQRRVGS